MQQLDAAESLVRRHFPPTPQLAWPLLAQRTGREIWVRHENHTPTRAGGMATRIPDPVALEHVSPFGGPQEARFLPVPITENLPRQPLRQLRHRRMILARPQQPRRRRP